MKSKSIKGIAVQDYKTGKRIVFREEIFILPRLRFLKQVAVQSFKLSDGEEGQWESVYNNACTVLTAALTPKKRLILVKLFRFPMHCDYLELPGGDAKEKEPLGVATRRELLEETGYASNQPLINLGGGPLCSGGTNARYFIFAALNCKKVGKPKLDPVEKLADLRVLTVSPKVILRKIAKGDHNVDPQLAHALLALQTRGII